MKLWNTERARKEHRNMVGGTQKAFPACVRSVKRGDIYYADFGSVEEKQKIMFCIVHGK